MRTIVIFSFLIICSFFISCTKNGDKIKDADMIEIYFNTGDTVYKYQDSSNDLIQDFIKVLNGKTEKRRCEAIGEIRFYSKDSILFLAGFSIGGRQNGCEFLMNNENAWRLTYRTGMYLSETFASLKRKDE